MIKNTKIGEKVVRVQIGTATRKGTSSMGTKYVKGDRIVHFGSTRTTGEVFILAEKDVRKLNLNYAWCNPHLKSVKPIKKGQVS